MRRAAAALEERGLESVYIHCSGDPDSLDGVIFPAIGTAIVDGTAPHGMDTLGHRCAYLSCSACSSWYSLGRVRGWRGVNTVQQSSYG